MINLKKKQQLIKLAKKLGDKNPEALLVPDLIKEIEKTRSSIPSPIDISPIYKNIQEILFSISENKKEIGDLAGSIASIKGFTDEEKESIFNEIKDISKENKKLTEELRLELINRIAQQGGGSMNRKISINRTVVSKRYTDINFLGSGITYSAADNDVTRQVDLTLTSSSGGYTKETPSGSLYDQNTGTGGITFTVTHTPVYIVADGATFFDGAGYTIAGLTVTMANPVTQYIRSFY